MSDSNGTEKHIFFVEKGENTRLDVFLASETSFTRSHIDRLNKNGSILVNGKSEKSGKALKEFDEIELTVPEITQEIIPEDIPLRIIYDDKDICVIDKQRGLSVHPSGGITTGTLVNAIMYHVKELSGIGGALRPGIVHRLDKDTTGVMVIAKNDKAHLSLSRQIAGRTVTKIYHAILEGNIKEDEGTINEPVGRSSRDRKLMAVVGGGREAITHYKVLERYKNNCLAEFNLYTGRTHQIRVHAKYIGHPVVGDMSYGFSKQKFAVGGQLLHSRRLTFLHPVSGESMTFSAEYPEDFERVLAVLRKQA